MKTIWYVHLFPFSSITACNQNLTIITEHILYAEMFLFLQSSRFKECSKGKLNLIPATGPNVDNGIINVYLNTAVTGVHYRTVGDEVNTKLKSMNGLTYNTKIFIMPDAVDFKGGAAWAYLFGDTIWIRNIFSHTPMVQVHGKIIFIILYFITSKKCVRTKLTSLYVFYGLLFSIISFFRIWSFAWITSLRFRSEYLLRQYRLHGKSITLG